MSTPGDLPATASDPGRAPARGDGPRPPLVHGEIHYSQRAGWLRALVLGANDGIVSTAALILGVAAADTAPSTVLTAGVAALVSGALSMAVGEYVSVNAQRDTEQADIATEARELASLPERELAELTAIYRERGLSPTLAHEVAAELTRHDALEAHVTDELGITELRQPRPLLAAGSSAGAFAMGAALPLLAAAVAPGDTDLAVVLVVALVALGALGALGARLGGAPAARPTLRVVVGGAIAMAATMAVGALVGTAV